MPTRHRYDSRLGSLAARVGIFVIAIVAGLSAQALLAAEAGESPTVDLPLRDQGTRVLTMLDWMVIGVYLLGMLAIGWYYSRRTTTREEYLLGGRSMGALRVGISLAASLVSTLTYLASPGEMIKNGPMFFCNLLAYPLVIVAVGLFIIPFIMRLKVTSAYEILEVRLGGGVRLLGSIMFLLMRLLWMAAIIYAATTKVICPLLGLDQSMATLVAVLMGGFTVLYTTMGGIRAVVLTDVIQSLLLLTAAIATLVVVTIALGGVGAWWPDHWLTHWQKPALYDPTARMTPLIAIVASFTWWVCASGSDQIAIQRYLSTRDAKSARTVLTVSLIADALVTLVLMGVGLALLAYFQTRPQLLPSGKLVFDDADQLFPRFIVVGLPVGISGLVVAGMLASAMSALSAGINSTCSVVTVDFIERFRKVKRSPSEAGQGEHVESAKWVSVLIGAVVVVLSLLIGRVHGNLVDICCKVINLLVAPLFGLFFMAMFVRWATGFGTLVGAAFGLLTAIEICYWEELTGTKGISPFWVMPLSLAVQIWVGSLASLLPIGAKAKPLDAIV
jgi:SSS family solute:Na+ symporter